MLLNSAALEKTLESPLDSKEIQPVHPKGNQPWIFIGRAAAEAEAPIVWPPDEKSWLTGKDPDAGKDWGHEEKGVTEDEMVGWYHRLNGQEPEQTPGDGEGQGSLACCSPWGCRVRHDWATEQEEEDIAGRLRQDLKAQGPRDETWTELSLASTTVPLTTFANL